ncbi:MAG: deoxyribonuclease IV [Candidatus Andersenbacteria bacterium]|nr:deoxyribonuclease IV [Candidatus Andersenbacteria bacterium]
MQFGAHISIAGGIEKAPERAHKIGCECFQMFSRSPHGGKAKEITESTISNFKKYCQKYNLKNYYIHTPYYINLASANNRIYYGSVSAIKKELENADLLGARAVVTHLGSAKDLGKKEAEKKLAEGLKKIFQLSPASEKIEAENKEIKFNAKLLLEITAGAGEIMGDNFEEIAYFIKEAEKEIPKNSLGVCFDTAHAFASGYDLRNKKAVKKTFDDFDKIIGLERLKLIHCNDSKVDLESHIDRHENIGYGKIGMEGFKAIIGEPRLNNLDFILETPLNKDRNDLKVLKELRKNL